MLPTRSCLAALALICALPALAGEAPPRAEGAQACGFFRNQAYGKGLGHFATEMLWACEAIARRRAAAMPLGDRLEATDAALARYREAVVAEAGRGHFRPGGFTEADKATLAEATGALTALAAISAGF
jgi:hypothetical protein